MHSTYGKIYRSARILGPFAEGWKNFFFNQVLAEVGQNTENPLRSDLTVFAAE